MENIDLDYKPWGGLAGVLAGQQQTMADNLNRAQLQQNTLNNIVKQRDAALAQDQTDSDQFRQAALQGAIGTNQSLAAKGQFDMSTLDARTKQAIAEGYSNADKATVEKERVGIDRFISAYEGSNGNPVMALDAISDPQMKQYAAGIIQKMGPDGAYNLAKQMRNVYTQLDADTGKHRGDMEKQALENQGRNESSRITANAHVQAAQIMADARIKAAESSRKATDLLSQVQSGKLSFEKAAVAFQVMADMEQNPDLQTQYAQKASQFQEAALKQANARAAGTPDIGSMGVPVQNVQPNLGVAKPQNLPDPLGIRK